MKKLVFIAIAFISLQAIAQGERRGAKHKNNKDHKMITLSAEEIATLQTKKMTLHLDLSESQQEKIQKINLENAQQRKEMMANFKLKKENGELEKPTNKARYDMQLKKLDQQIAMKDKMKAILNKEQFLKWKESIKSRNFKTKQKRAILKKKHIQ